MKSMRSFLLVQLLEQRLGLLNHKISAFLQLTGELRKLDAHLNTKLSVCDELLIGCNFANIECRFSCAGCEAQMPHKDIN